MTCVDFRVYAVVMLLLLVEWCWLFAGSSLILLEVHDWCRGCIVTAVPEKLDPEWH
jgi:hypothetical protein